MAISGVVQFSGRLRFTPPVPGVDNSSNPAQFSDVIETMVCSAQESGMYTLISDADTVVGFGALAVSGADLVIIKVMPNFGTPPSPGYPNGVPATPNPITVKLTGPTNVVQAVAVSGFLYLSCSGVPYFGMSLARSPGVQTVVRVQLFSLGS